SVTANYAVLDYASRYRQTLLMNFWRMGRNSVERGRQDTWTVYPRRVDSVRAVIAAERQGQRAEGNAVMSAGGLFGGAPNPEQSARYLAALRRPEWRDPRAYVIPSDQTDFPTATKFVNALRENGIQIHRATASFSAGGKTYPAGSFVVRLDQPFRPHVLDMFEPQDHPNDFLYEGGPPIPPYDNAGWTLAYQMGVEFDRILDALPAQAPLQAVDAWNLPAPEGRIATPRWAPQGYILSPQQNDAFTAVNRLLKEGIAVHRLTRAGDRGEQPGDFWVEAPGRAAFQMLTGLGDSLGVRIEASPRLPRGAVPLRQPRIGLVDRYGGIMPSGWTRWIFEEFGFPYSVVFPPELDAGNLNAKYDVLVFVDGTIPERDPRAGAGGGGGFNFMPSPDAVPEEFRGQLGMVTIAQTVPKLREFLENGGTVLTIGGATVLARHLGLPVEDHLVEAGPDGQPRHLPREKYYIPGSLLRVAVDNDAPVAWGMPEQATVMFDDSPVFRLGAGAEAAGIRRIAWFDTETPLRSGWAWGQQHLNGGAAIVSAPVGRGTLYLFGPEIAFRAQPHGTFRLLFNGLYESVTDEAQARR
ncbi:MAG TPA: hypothetical protein VEQ60_17375, partial [Longimicrobium sp.]|nr:hypothetical protein [Longimicrobium sp.]